jgi:serine/threonine-protein kinase RsbW
MSMMMKSDFNTQLFDARDLVQVRLAGVSSTIVQLTIMNRIHDISWIPAIVKTFEGFLKRGYTSFIVDLGRLDQLTPSLIVVLFELTARVRRRGGNVAVINIKESARSYLDRFHPLDYLMVAKSKAGAVESLDPDRRVPSPTPDLTAPPLQKEPSKGTEQHPPSGPEEVLKVPSRVQSLYKACDFVIERAKTLGFDETSLGKMKLAVYEACLNVIEHAYHSDTSREVEVRVQPRSDVLVIKVVDYGEGFKVDHSDEFDVLEAVSNRKTGGMGLYIIRKAMDQVRYKLDSYYGNQLIMIKNIPDSVEKG